MMRLIGKELKQLLPYTFLWLSLLALYIGVELSTLRIDESSYLSWCEDYCNVGANIDIALFNIVLYMIAAYSLFPREFDDSTIDFLRSLPIARSKIYIAKIASAWILLCSLLFLERILQFSLLSLNTQSITGSRYIYNDVIFLTRDCLFAFVIVAHGVIVSWFRTIGLIIYSTYLIVLVWLETANSQTGIGKSGVYNILTFFDNEYDGSKLLVDWTSIGFHVVVAVLLLMIGYKLWTNTDSRPRASGGGKLNRILPIVFSVLAFVFFAIYMLNLMLSASVESDIKRLETEHYKFSYRASNESAMEELASFSESDYDALVDMLGVSEQPIIRVDMTSDSSHALGLASWKKIRMVLKNDSDVNPLYRRVLSHETAHVFQSVESNRTLAKSANTVGFFIEGMAQYTSFTIVPDHASRESNWLISSIAWQRHNIKFEELANRNVFESLYDPELLYGIGDIWVDAMAQTCGQSSIGDFLRAIGRDNAPPNLAGATYWRTHLQFIGCDLESVNNQWRQLMQAAIDDRQNGAFPYFENVVVSRSDTTDLITISADLRVAESGLLPKSFHVRIQSEANLTNAVSPVLNGKLVQDGDSARVDFSVLPRLIDGKRFKYQLGYTPIPDSRGYYDRWRSGSLPD